MPCWGSSEPGTLPSASRNSRTRATRIEVSWRQPQRAQATTPKWPAAGRATGASAASRSPSAGSSGGSGSAASAWGVWTSVIGSGSRGHFGKDAVEAAVAGGADDPPGDALLLIDDQRARDRGGRHGAAEVQRDLVAGVVQARIADAEILHEGLGRRRLVADIDADEPDTLDVVLLGQHGQRRCLLAARRAPGGTEVQHDPVTAVGAEAELAAGQRGAGHRGRGGPVARLVVRGRPVAGHEVGPVAG